MLPSSMIYAILCRCRKFFPYRGIAVAKGRILLTGVSPSIAGLHWETDQLLRIGRQPNLDIVVIDPSLGREHAEIRKTPQGWVVQDLGYATGTFLNGVRLGKVTRKLQKEDVLQCGKLTFKITDLEWERPVASSSMPHDIKTSGPMVRVQAFSQLSWEQGTRALPLEDASLPHAKQFLALLRAGYHLSRIDSIDELLQSVLDDTVAVLNAQRGTVVLMDETTGELTLKTTSGAKSRDAGRPFSHTLAQRCFSRGESLLCLDHQAAPTQTGNMVPGDMASIICALLRSPRKRLGVLHLDRGPMQEPFSQEDFKLADAIASTISVGIESAFALEKQRAAFLREVTELAQQTMATRDPATAQHCRRVRALALVLGEELRLSGPEKTQLQLGAVLHDLGKIGSRLSSGFLSRHSEKLSPEEETQLKRHPVQGVAIAEKFSGFAPALPIIRSHHEYWDGTGYPDGLKGEQIPHLAQVVAIADRLDHLLAGGPHQPALPIDKAIKDVKAQAGRMFDPKLLANLQTLGPRLEQFLDEEIQK